MAALGTGVIILIVIWSITLALLTLFTFAQSPIRYVALIALIIAGIVTLILALLPRGELQSVANSSTTPTSYIPLIRILFLTFLSVTFLIGLGFVAVLEGTTLVIAKPIEDRYVQWRDLSRMFFFLFRKGKSPDENKSMVARRRVLVDWSWSVKVRPVTGKKNEISSLLDLSITGQVRVFETLVERTKKPSIEWSRLNRYRRRNISKDRCARESSSIWKWISWLKSGEFGFDTNSFSREEKKLDSNKSSIFLFRRRSSKQTLKRNVRRPMDFRFVHLFVYNQRSKSNSKWAEIIFVDELEEENRFRWFHSRRTVSQDDRKRFALFALWPSVDLRPKLEFERNSLCLSSRLRLFVVGRSLCSSRFVSLCRSTRIPIFDVHFKRFLSTVSVTIDTNVSTEVRSIDTKQVFDRIDFSHLQDFVRTKRVNVCVPMDSLVWCAN